MEPGYLYAFAAFALIGSYMVPARFASAKGMAFLPSMALGLLILDLGMIPQIRLLLEHPLWLACTVMSGLLWVTGQGLANAALEEISLAKASVFFNINSFLNIALGLAVFHEASGLKAYLLLMGGGVLLFLGAWIVAKVSAVSERERNLKKGAVLSLLAGFFWGVYFVPIQALQSGPEGVSLGSAAISGMILGGAVPALIMGLFRGKENWTGKNMGLGLLTALLWICGTLCFLRANQSLGLSRAVPIVNSNVLVYSGWSLLFKELPLSQWPRLLGGALVVVLGVALMALSK